MKLLLMLFMLLSSLQVLAQIPTPNRPGYCPLAQNIQCENFVISHLSPWDYDDQYEYSQIRNNCAGNYGTNCLAKITSHLSPFEKDDLYELATLSNSCQLSNAACISFIANKLSPFDFDDIYEVTEVARACARVDLRCIKQTCSVNRNACRGKFNLLQTARSCYQGCY